MRPGPAPPRRSPWFCPEAAPALRQIPPEARSLSAVPLRVVDLLSINPGVSLEGIAGNYLDRLPRALRRVLAGSGADSDGTAGLASYLLFDRDFCGELIALGRRDGEARNDEIRAFLSAR